MEDRLQRLNIWDEFSPAMRSPHWNRLASGCAWVEERDVLQLILQDTPAGSLSLAQIDDCLNRPRESYLWRPPLTVKTRVRTSHHNGDLLGSAGFGFWNNMRPLWSDRMEVRPNWIWFYYASPQSTVSLTSGPTSGWKASIVHAGRGSKIMMRLIEPFVRMPGFGKLLVSSRFPAREASLKHIDFTQWHDFEIQWLPDRVIFWIDGQAVLQASLRLSLPLAFVAWIDNNFAALDSKNELDVGHLAIHQRQVLEMERVEIRSQ